MKAIPQLAIAAGTDYLFIESGGFSDENPAGWRSARVVMQRGGKPS